MASWRIIETGRRLRARGTRALYISYTQFDGPRRATLRDISDTFDFADRQHHHYLLGDPQSIGVSATDAQALTGGTLWIPASTHPPGDDVWPGGSRIVNLTTPDSQQSGNQTGDMTQSHQGTSVYIPWRLLFCIPDAAFQQNIVWNFQLLTSLGPEQVPWTVDF